MRESLSSSLRIPCFSLRETIRENLLPVCLLPAGGDGGGGGGNEKVYLLFAPTLRLIKRGS